MNTKSKNILIVTKLKLLIFLFMIAIVLASCTTKIFHSKEELVKYIMNEENGYTQSKMINGVLYTLTYRPTDLLVNQEIGDNITSERIEELRAKYDRYLYFNLSMSKNNKELLSTAPKNRSEFGEMVNQLAFGMGKKVHLYTKSKDTIEMTDFIYPRMYGISKKTSMLFVFPREEDKLQEDYVNFTVQDLGLYTGEVKFKIASKQLKDELQLSFKN
ncbi:hypothetical protein [Tenacibaculum halocynthiae]|uniref:hypothetical protein n=1 Tax=Tenacibaculum halocynthiae TaxID=1254437 RepID=UPI003D6524A9